MTNQLSKRSRAVHTGLAAFVATSVVFSLAISGVADAAPTSAVDPAEVQPVDPQNWIRQEDQTWDDYKELPKRFDWAHHSGGTQRTFKGAIVLIDFEDFPFTVTKPIDDTKPLTNPLSILGAPITREQVPEYYRKLLNTPQDLNHGRTINEFWLEQTGGAIGVELEAFGPYQLPGDYAQYGLADSFQQKPPLTYTQDQIDALASRTYDAFAVDNGARWTTAQIESVTVKPTWSAAEIAAATTKPTWTTAQITAATVKPTWSAVEIAAASPALKWTTAQINLANPKPTWSAAEIAANPTLTVAAGDPKVDGDPKAAGEVKVNGDPKIAGDLKLNNDPKAVGDPILVGDRRPLVDGTFPTGNTNAAICPLKYYVAPYNALGKGCSGSLRTQAQRLWAADLHAKGILTSTSINPQTLFDSVFYVNAGRDETSTWEELGKQIFSSPAAVTDEYGPPRDAAGKAYNGYGEVVDNSAPTRYIPWTSYAAAVSQWPGASGNASTQAESSGAGVYAHEFTHILGIGDNYGNPYETLTGFVNGPDGPRRDTGGPWDILSRGAFNGPGGTHTRYAIPSVAGGSQSSGVPVRNRIRLGVLKDVDDGGNLLTLAEEEIDKAGSITSTVTSRAVQRPGDITGIQVAFDKPDTAPADNSTGLTSRTTHWDSDGGNYDNYTVEVVDRIGTDSFQPDHGVVISKTKNGNSAPFLWAIDANPEDIDLVDYIQPDGTVVKVTRGDQRQLNDSAFHAGTDSGSKYEYVDEPNGLQFYITNVNRDYEGILQYDVTIRSTSNAGSAKRLVEVGEPVVTGDPSDGLVKFVYPVKNTGTASDIFRLEPSIATGSGWNAWVREAVVVVDAGRTVYVPVYAKKTTGSTYAVDVQTELKVTSENSKAADSTGVVSATSSSIPKPPASELVVPDLSISLPNEATTTGTNVVKVAVSGSGVAPTGSVQVVVDGVSVSQTLVSGAAQVTLPTLSAGTHTVAVKYLGDAVYLAVSDKVSLTVTVPGAPKPPVLLAPDLSVSVPAGFSTDTTNVVKVAVSGSGVAPTGSVQVVVDGVSVSQTLVSGAAQVTLPTLSAGTHTVAVKYLGDAVYFAVSDKLSVQVTAPGAPKPPVLLTPDLLVSLPVGVTTAGGKSISVAVSGSAAAPYGVIEVIIGGKTVSSVLTPGAAAKLTLPTVDAGTHTVLVKYAGNADYAPASERLTLVVTEPDIDPTPTTTPSITPTTAPPVVGGAAPQLSASLSSTAVKTVDQATVTAVVSHSSAVPSGDVTATVAGRTASAKLVAGKATITLPKLAAGSYEVSVSYAGDTAFAPSSALAGTISVTKAVPSAVTSKLASSSIKKSQKAKVAVTVKHKAVKAPLGKVTVTVLKGKKTAAAKTITLKASNKGKVTVSLAKLKKGTYKVKVAYKGDSVLSAKSATVKTLKVK